MYLISHQILRKMNKIIEIKDLSFTYPDGNTALRNFNLDIYEGESIAIIGPNGAGKSTLLLHLNGFFRGNGNVHILDMKTSGSNLKEIRKKVGIIFQDPDDQLFMPTVVDDVSFGPLHLGIPNAKIPAIVDEALSKVEMTNYKERSSHHLSIGEKKRIAIATVLSMQPEILVIDEPTSNLDPHSRRELINLLKSINNTKIIASHDLELVLETCDRTVLMNRGKNVLDGKTMDVLVNQPILETNGLEMPISLSKL